MRTACLSVPLCVCAVSELVDGVLEELEEAGCMGTVHLGVMELHGD